MESDDIGTREQFVEGHYLYPAGVAGSRIGHDDLSIESRQAARNRLTNRAEADDADRRAVQFPWHERASTLPFPVAHGPIVLHDATEGGQHQCERVIRRRLTIEVTG